MNYIFKNIVYNRSFFTSNQLKEESSVFITQLFLANSLKKDFTKGKFNIIIKNNTEMQMAIKFFT